MKFASISIPWGDIILPYESAVKVIALLKDARSVKGHADTRKLVDTEAHMYGVPDITIQALEQAAIYGTTISDMEEKLLDAKHKPTKSIEKHPDLLSK